MNDLTQLHSDFEKHQMSDALNFKEIHDKLDNLTKMVTPIYKTFNFREELGNATKKWIINTTKICGLVLAIAGVVALVWKLFVYAIIQVK